MNLIPEIMRMLNINKGEEFQISGVDDRVYCFSGDRICCRIIPDKFSDEPDGELSLWQMLHGDRSIIKFDIPDKYSLGLDINAQPVEDPVNHPDHYTRGNIECIDAIDAATTGLRGSAAYCTGQVIKYIWRWRWKGKKLEDLKKCRWYLDRLIAHVESEEK